MAQLVYTALICRRYIQITVELLTTRINKPAEEDCMKLNKCFKYLKGTKHMKLTISVD